MTTPISDQPQKERSDADPMIDALLAEFVPSSAARRLRPPNLTAKIIAQLASSEPVEVAESKRIEALQDSDPLIDTLLAEFLPTEPEARFSPPDLSAKILEQLSATHDDAADETEATGDVDHVIDGLLPEFVPAETSKRKTPPNLSPTIMAQLTSTDAATRSPVTLRQPSGQSYSLARTVSLLAAIAASIIGVIWLTGQPNGQNGVTQIDPPPSLIEDVGNDGGDLSSGSNGTGESDQNGGSGFASNSPRQLGPIEDELDVPEDSGAGERQPNDEGSLDPSTIAGGSDPASSEGNPGTGNPGLIPAAKPVRLVASEAAETARQYWTAIGITPTPEAPPSEVSARLKKRLGVEFSEQALDDPQRLRDLLAKSSNAGEITKRWLALTTGNSIASIARPENNDLVKELSAGIAGGSQLDVTLVSLIDGSNAHSSRWYDTLSQGNEEGIAKRLASISINADLRCVRCHDSHIGRSGTQDDYWSFVALVRNVVTKKDNRWVVSDSAKSVPTYFEFLDGTLHLARPKVSGYLLQSPNEVNDFRAWTKTLVGSDALAGSLVDSLWQLVHGRPLKPSPVDAFAPPVDEHLNRLHQLLADDLKRSRFDVARTLALIVSSPMARRSVPEALRNDAMLSATDKQRSAALELVGAFAAAVETPPSAMQDRVDVAMRRIGGRLSLDQQGTVLGQADLRVPRDPKSRPPTETVDPVMSFAQQLSVDFPGGDAPVPVLWLGSIEDFERKVDHLVYLSGKDKTSAEIMDTAKRLREAGNEDSALSRIWWILRN